MIAEDSSNQGWISGAEGGAYVAINVFCLWDYIISTKLNLFRLSVDVFFLLLHLFTRRRSLKHKTQFRLN